MSQLNDASPQPMIEVQNSSDDSNGPLTATISYARVEAFKGLFHGGIVLPDDSLISRFRHLRGSRPVDDFSSDAEFDSFVEGEFNYIGPVYYHFGHFMSEMVHRIVPTKKLFSCDRWLMVGCSVEKHLNSTEKFPEFLVQIFDYLNIKMSDITIVSQNSIVRKINISEPGAVPGLEPNRSYLDLVGAFSQNRLDEIYKNSDSPNKVYVTRSGLAGAGAFLGEKYLESLLEKHGFTIFFPELHEISKQMDVYRRADILIFSEGSACHGVELLGGDMLNRCYLLARRDSHADAFSKVLKSRSKEFNCLKAPQLLGVLAVNPNTKIPYENLAVSVFDVDALVEFFRENQICDLEHFSATKYFEMAEIDLYNYYDFYQKSGVKFVDWWNVGDLKLNFLRKKQESMRA